MLTHAFVNFPFSLDVRNDEDHHSLFSNQRKRHIFPDAGCGNVSGDNAGCGTARPGTVLL
jgi:hypothetical protein